MVSNAFKTTAKGDCDYIQGKYTAIQEKHTGFAHEEMLDVNLGIQKQVLFGGQLTGKTRPKEKNMNPIFQEDVDFIPSKMLDTNHQQTNTQEDDVFYSASTYNPVDNLQKSPRKSAMKKTSMFQGHISENETIESGSIPVAPIPPPLPNVSSNSQSTVFQESPRSLSPPPRKGRKGSSISFTSDTIDNEGKGKRYKSERLDIGIAGFMDKIRPSSNPVNAVNVNQAYVPDDKANIKGGLTDDEKVNSSLLMRKTDIIPADSHPATLNQVSTQQDHNKVPNIGIGVIKVPQYTNIASVTVTDPSISIQVNKLTPPNIAETSRNKIPEITQPPPINPSPIVMETNGIYLENNAFQNGHSVLGNSNLKPNTNTNLTSQNEHDVLQVNSQYRRLVSKVEQRKRHIKACKITWLLIGLIVLVVVILVIIVVLLRQYGRI